MTLSPDTVTSRQHRESPADPAAIAALLTACPIDLPAEYLAPFAFSNGGGGPLAVEPGWFQLWPAEDVLALNRDYGVQQQLPSLFGFGSNGGGELLGLRYPPRVALEDRDGAVPRHG